MTIMERLFPYKCPICNEPMMFEISIRAHLSIDHTWWQRIKHWAMRQ